MIRTSTGPRIWLLLGWLLLPAAGQAAPPADAWPGRAALDERQAWIAPSSRWHFGVDEHLALTGTAARCAEELLAAQWRQDSPLQRLSAAAHWDDCAFPASLAYLRQELDAVERLAGSGSATTAEVTKAMGHLGRVVHLLQDFYAHTDYVERMDQAGLPFGEALVVKLWLPEGERQLQELVQKGLQSGQYRLIQRADPRCPRSHGQLAKDTASSVAGKQWLPRLDRTAYRAAYDLADLSTRSFLEHAYRRWSALNKGCEGVAEYLPLRDRRSP